MTLGAPLLPLPAERTATADDLAACRELLRKGSKSFFAASLLLPKRVRVPMLPVYAFCRVADDVVDQASEPGAVEALQARLAAAYEGNPHDSPVDRAFSDVARAHDLPRAVMEALIEGFAWDAAGRRYETLSDLHAYCARVASTVGVIMSVLMGVRDPKALARACDLGVAMQLTNIARDVGEDARNGRVYLPLAWLEEAGIDVEPWVARPVFTAALGGVVERLLRHASGLYARADLGIPMLPRDCRASIRAASLIYADIGRVVFGAGFDSVTSRAYVPLGRKLWLLLRALAAPTPRVPLPHVARDAQVGPPALPEVQFLVDACARSNRRGR
ncbi:phytoene/squalene synthase family protein [Polyangium sorediatum]|uniref:Phytoene/squalene synthase family protein n=1 Tax=Polyangium sorediatum TaxID=889274 RepID=A0ABT6NIP5_9BACT|nr:phytoene/squalene synthase family protein [Polyangium sorediatum]MDI1428172.1 phytoene/squalene synthase family protein [Polyangium sorediatum]